MSRTIETTVYKYDELSDEAKWEARDWFTRGYPEYDWWDGVYETINTLARVVGIACDKRKNEPAFSFELDRGSYFSLSGMYSYDKGWKQEAVRVFGDVFNTGRKDDIACFIREYAEFCDNIQRPNFYGVQARMTVTYYGGGREGVNVDVERYLPNDTQGDVSDTLQASVETFIGSFCETALSLLQAEYDYLLSEENVEENIRVNEYEFTEDGNPA